MAVINTRFLVQVPSRSTWRRLGGLVPGLARGQGLGGDSPKTDALRPNAHWTRTGSLSFFPIGQSWLMSLPDT